ncbi:acylphosphatase [Cupriavidus pinatubonensis]|uniref:acylphosphatase n=1 Tax=Cupriavidus pinatubonensis TaxID=248026 RepID=A0ABM8XS82_9BURK|nr:acylphosphatase [Cupriavidus pinatubonensis]CAG9183189.1 Acylphosphatase [Cupriavidus pinatubonensis]
METWHMTAHGCVQGVGYRAGCAQAAIALGVRGWVRNRADGTVEVMASGTIQQLEALRNWMQAGPPAAHVTRVDVEPGQGKFEDFDLRPTL